MAEDVNLTAHLHLVPRSRMLGAIPPLLQYAFMAWSLVEAQGRPYLLSFILIILVVLLGKKK
jgi:hypothetical protein